MNDILSRYMIEPVSALFHAGITQKLTTSTRCCVEVNTVRLVILAQVITEGVFLRVCTPAGKIVAELYGILTTILDHPGEHLCQPHVLDLSGPLVSFHVLACSPRVPLRRPTTVVNTRTFVSLCSSLGDRAR